MTQSGGGGGGGGSENTFLVVKKEKWCIYIAPFPCNMLKGALQ